MYCTKCGKEVDNAANYCVYCGNQLTAIREQAIITQKPTKASFVISESFRTTKDCEVVLNKLEEQFRIVSQKVERKSANEFCVKSIAKTFFVSSFRKDSTTVFLVKTENKYTCAAYVVYRMPVFEQILLGFLVIIFFFAGTLSLIGFLYILAAIICYFSQKNTVRTAISNVLKRVKDEVQD